MTTEADVNKIIDAEFKAWNDSVFDLEPLPKDILELFKTAVFKLPPKVHQLTPDTIKRVSNRKFKEITNLDIPIMVNAIQHLPICEYATTFEQGLIKYTQIENIKIGYSLTVQKLNHQMEQKRQTLLKLSNPSKSKLTLAQA